MPRDIKKEIAEIENLREIENKIDWEMPDNEEIKKIVQGLSDKGVSLSEIGMVLRDQYAVPNVRLVTNKKLKEITDKKGMMPDDISALIAKADNLKKHLKSSPKDRSNRRGLQILLSKINRLARYYKRKGIVSDEFHYR